jgi:hypothetical protein
LLVSGKSGVGAVAIRGVVICCEQKRVGGEECGVAVVGVVHRCLVPPAAGTEWTGGGVVAVAVVAAVAATAASGATVVVEAFAVRK